MSPYEELGWQHELWDVVRYFRSIGKDEKQLREFWLKQLREQISLAVVTTKCEIHGTIPLKGETINLFFEYLVDSEKQCQLFQTHLRTEAEALNFCERLGVLPALTTTKSQDHHQSSKSLVAAVTQLSSEIAKKFELDIDINPQRRCVWFKERDLHVTARNLDGAIPCLINPFVVWEIKEYWGKTKGGSKMSDAVYECLLVGRELREYEEKHKSKIYHVVFIDGKEQWKHRVSDFVRFIDLYNQGIIDELIIGKDIELKWNQVLSQMLFQKQTEIAPEIHAPVG